MLQFIALSYKAKHLKLLVYYIIILLNYLFTSLETRLSFKTSFFMKSSFIPNQKCYLSSLLLIACTKLSIFHILYSIVMYVYIIVFLERT